MADVASVLYSWSATAASNSPSGTTSVATGLDDNLREIQKVVRGWLATKGSSIASAATVDLGAVEGLSHTITVGGVTTVTSFGTVSAGIWKVIILPAGLTLTHNATSLILPGAASITTAAGDVAILQSEGSGNWRVWEYTPAAWFVRPSRSVLTATGLTGGGTLAADRTIALDVNAITEDTTPDTSADFMLTYDTSAAAHKKVKPVNIVPVATAAEMETGSSTTVYVTPGRVNRHAGVAKAAIKFTVSGGTPTATDTYNTSSSITDNGTGDFTITWSTAFSSANYEYVLSTESSSTTSPRPISVRTGGQATTTLRIVITDMTNVSADPPAVCAIGFGDWA